MKQQDIAIIIVIVFFAGIFSFILSNKFITPSTKKLQAETVEPITNTFNVAGISKNINANSTNPTALVEIAPNENPEPFAETSN